MTSDPSKGTGVEYNYLNLPEHVTFDLDDEIRYTYDAAGNKRIKVVDGTNAENNTRIDYSGNFLYENNDLKAIFTSAGRIVPFNNNGEVLYKFVQWNPVFGSDSEPETDGWTNPDASGNITCRIILEIHE